MFCTFCNSTRPANETPCQQCGAPSPLVTGMNRSNGTPPSAPWGGPIIPGSSGQWNNAEQWAAFQGTQQAQQPSMLPVPFQQSSSLIMSKDENGMIPYPVQSGSALLPALPDDANAPVHILPMYTKPRPIIPRYRAISGLLSVIIVSILLCSGAGYYAKASGKLTFLKQAIDNTPPQSLQTTPFVSPSTPKPAEYYNPADLIINSASTDSSIDPATGIVLQPANVFAPGQIIYLTYSVHPNKTGKVILKWYTNGLLYSTVTTPPIEVQKNGTYKNGTYQIAFGQPLSGKVELYWDNTNPGSLAIRLYFIVH